MKRISKGEKNYIIKVTAFGLLMIVIVLATLAIVSVLIKSKII